MDQFSESEDELLQRYIDVLGPDLGVYFNHLWSEYYSLQVKWGEYKALFGTSASRVELLNVTVPFFAFLIQGVLWNDILLSISKLTDKAETRWENRVSLLGLSKRMTDIEVRKRVDQLVSEVLHEASIVRKWRNKVISHSDLAVMTHEGAVLLEGVSRNQIDAILKKIFAVLREIEQTYFEWEVADYVHSEAAGSEELLYLLREGLEARKQRSERKRTGKATREDFKRPSL